MYKKLEIYKTFIYIVFFCSPYVNSINDCVYPIEYYVILHCFFIWLLLQLETKQKQSFVNKNKTGCSVLISLCFMWDCELLSFGLQCTSSSLFSISLA